MHCKRYQVIRGRLKIPTYIPTKHVYVGYIPICMRVEPIMSEHFNKTRAYTSRAEPIREREENQSFTVHAHNARCMCAAHRYVDMGYWSIDRFGTLPAVHATLVLSDRGTVSAIGDTSNTFDPTHGQHVYASCF